MNCNYYIGPWVSDKLSDNDPSDYYWRAPDNTIGLIDFGSLSNCGLSPKLNNSRNVGIFALPFDIQLGLDWYLIGSGDCREVKPSGIIRDSVESLLGVKSEGDTIAEWVGNFLFNQGDPLGQERWKIGLPTRQQNFDLHLGGELIWSRPFQGVGDVSWNIVRDCLRTNLFAIASMNPVHAEKVLGAMITKYGCDSSELSQEISPMIPKTTFADDFSGTLDSWTAYSSTWEISGGRARKTADNSSFEHMYVTAGLSAADHSAQAVQYYASICGGPAIRCYTAAQSFYSLYRSVSNYSLSKVVGGSYTSLDNDICPASGATWLIDGNGSTISGNAGGNLTLATDSVLSSVYPGLSAFYTISQSGPEFDDFYTTDGLADNSIVPILLSYRQRWT